MSSDWVPWAIKKTYSGYGGNNITGSAKKITLHTTETSVLPNYSGSAPHLTVNPITGEAWQHVPLSKGSYALKSPGAPNSPNMNAGINIQIEVIGYAKDTPGYSDAWYSALAYWVNWLCDDWGVPKVFFSDFVPNSSGSTRQSWGVWQSSSGLTGHQNVPYNDHWDPGGLDQGRLLHFMGAPVPPQPNPIPPALPPFPFPAGHWMGQTSSDSRNHSGYYTADQPGIRQYQQQMRDRGWSIGVDGLYGPQSESVTRSFQAEKGLVADGLAGEQTWHAAWTAPVT